MKFRQSNLQAFVTVAMSMALVQGQIIPIGPPTVIPQQSPAAKPVAGAPVTSASAVATKANAPRDMKLLVVAVDGTEPSYAAVKSFIETLGIPYQTVFTVKPSATGAATLVPLPALTDAGGTKGYFQGIVLTNGNLGYCGGAGGCISGMSGADWTRLEAYARDFSVRLVSYYTWPEPRYGLAFSQGVSTNETPQAAALTGDAASVFPYLNLATPVPIANAYMYLATAAPAVGETTTPFLTVGGLIAGAINRKADGREYLALTVDNNPYLTHSLELSYGILNWVTKGVFLGGRKVYLTPQVDDLFLGNDLYVNGIAACTPVGFVNDPTYDPANACPSLRITGADFQAVADWQSRWNQNPQFKNFKTTHAFNGVGATSDNGALLTNDSLLQSLPTLKSKFWWLNHTWDHEDLDCYNPTPNAGAATCVAATYNQSLTELNKNFNMGRTLALPVDAPSMVTPGISGLKNPAFLRAAVAQGIKYVVSDTSKPDYLPAIPNTGIRNPFQSSILMIPRRPTNLFYNTTTGVAGVPGSLPDEYNHFFGPDGIFRIGGPGGPPFFPTVQSYADIINRESDNLLGYMMRYEIYPQMYHQSNLYRFSGSSSMFSDVHDAAFTKFARVSNLPVLSLSQTDIGKEIERKMGVIAAGVSGVLTPGVNISLTAAKGTATALVTGVCAAAGCESYGAQCMSQIAVKAGSKATVALGGGGTCGAIASPVSTTTTTTSAPAASTPTAATPQVQTQAVVRSIAALIATVTDKDIVKSLTEAQAALTNSLTPSKWTFGMPNTKSIFDDQQKAAQKLTDVLKKKGISDSTSLAVRGLLDSLATTDMGLVSDVLALLDVFMPNSKELDKAAAAFQKGSDLRSQGRYEEAIDQFGKAVDSILTAFN